MELRIKEILKIKRLTSVWLASQIDITQPNMSNIVSGKSSPSLETLEKIADALGVSIVELFEPDSEFYGIIQYKGVMYRIDSIESFERLVRDVYSNPSEKE